MLLRGGEGKKDTRESNTGESTTRETLMYQSTFDTFHRNIDPANSENNHRPSEFNVRTSIINYVIIIINKSFL